MARGFRGFDRFRRNRRQARRETFSLEWPPVTEREFIKAAMHDPERHLHGKEGASPLRSALEAVVDRAAIAQKAAREGISPHQKELEARLNIASFFAAPEKQLPQDRRDRFIAHAARGEEWYAYAPLSLDPRTAEWNLWREDAHGRGERIRLNDMMRTAGGEYESVGEEP